MDYVIASSWDQMVRCWEVKETAEGTRGEGRAATTHDAPVLSTCFSGDGNKVFSGDCNKQVMCWDLVSNQSSPLDGNRPIVCSIIFFPFYFKLLTFSTMLRSLLFNI